MLFKGLLGVLFGPEAVVDVLEKVTLLAPPLLVVAVIELLCSDPSEA